MGQQGKLLYIYAPSWSSFPANLPRLKLQDLTQTHSPTWSFQSTLKQLLVVSCTKPSMMFLPSFFLSLFSSPWPPSSLSQSPVVPICLLFSNSKPLSYHPFCLPLVFDGRRWRLGSSHSGCLEVRKRGLAIDIVVSSLCLTIQPPLLLWALNSCLILWGWLVTDVDRRWNWWDWSLVTRKKKHMKFNACML